MVREIDGIIIGSAAKHIDEKTAKKNGYKIFEIDSSEFKVEMIGSKLQGFELN